MKLTAKFYLIVICTSISILAITLFTSLQILSSNSKSSDVSVALNAEEEEGYDSTIFVITKTNSGDLGICGGTIVDRGVAVTAAHCVDGMKEIYIGNEIFDSNEFESFVTIDDYVIKEGWQTSFATSEWKIENMAYDLAILYFDEESNIPVSTISSINLGCGYEIVSYGTRLDEINDEFLDLSVPRNKQRISVCIENTSDNLMFVIPESNTGLCFGDSGSPVFKTGTNEVVGVLSSLISLDDSENICALNNFGLAVRLDNNSQMVIGEDYMGNRFMDSISEEDFKSFANTIDLDYLENDRSEKTNLEREKADPPQQSFGNTITMDATFFYGIALISLFGITILIVFGLYLLYKGFLEVSVKNEERLFNHQQYT